MIRRGTTLVETIISIVLISIVVVTLLESMNVGMTGTLQLSRKTTALNYARSQMEYIKTEGYNSSTGDLSDVYGIITSETTNISDTVNYTITGTVTNVSENQSLQEITVTVSYLAGKELQLTGYKAARESLSTPPAKGHVVSDVIEDFPFESPGGWSLGCWDLWEWLTGSSGCGTWTGYYHVFTTSQDAYISATWEINWTNEQYENLVYGAFTWGAPFIGIYEGIPDWAQRDYQGQVYKDGVVFQPGSDSFTSGGCMPGCNCDSEEPDDDPPIAMYPEDCDWDSGVENWTYEHRTWEGMVGWDVLTFGYIQENGHFEFSMTTEDPVPAGTYTVLFFNGEDRISFETVSASVTYVY